MKKITKLFALLLCIVTAVCIIAATASAAEVVASGECGENVTWKLTDDGTLTISGEGNMTNYLFEEYPWHEYANQIKRIIIGSEVKSIKAESIYSTPNLQSIEVEEGSEYFLTDNYGVLFSADGTLYRAPVTIEGVYEIPYGVKTVGSSAFNFCTKLTGVTFLQP
jgi:hypothetical protein